MTTRVMPYNLEDQKRGQTISLEILCDLGRFFCLHHSEDLTLVFLIYQRTAPKSCLHCILMQDYSFQPNGPWITWKIMTVICKLCHKWCSWGPSHCFLPFVFRSLLRLGIFYCTLTLVSHFLHWEGVLGIKASALDLWDGSAEPTRRKEKTESYTLSFDLPDGTVAGTPLHTHMPPSHKLTK